jgi:hypothetical protein
MVAYLGDRKNTSCVFSRPKEGSLDIFSKFRPTTRPPGDADQRYSCNIELKTDHFDLLGDHPCCTLQSTRILVKLIEAYVKLLSKHPRLVGYMCVGETLNVS